MKMKTTYILGLLAFGMSLTACTADDPHNNSNANPGDEIEFLISSNGTRTMYGEENADGTAQGLYWGNYNDWIGDSIKIFSPQCRFGKARYVVNKKETNSNVAASVTRIGENGLQWGEASAAHDFYAFYPASGCSDDATAEGQVDAWIQQGQSPVKFVSATENGTTVYLGQPNMNACVMTACTLVQPENYGNPVSLHFRPLATVLDVTVNGPKNTNDEKIYMITLKSKSGKAIAGNFKVDMKENKLVDGSITNGSSEIVMQPRDMQYDDNHQPSSASNITISPTAQMKVRFFLIPRNDLELSDLQVTVITEKLEFKKTLTPSDVSGSTTTATLPASKITKVSLPKFDENFGKEFNLNYWVSELQPNIYLTELTIPGADDAASSILTGASKMQAVVAQKQFESGVRAFKLSVFNKFSYDYNKKDKSYTYSGKTLCYGNNGTYGHDPTKDDKISVGTVADLFSKLHGWLTTEKSNWEKAHPGEPFQDFVVLCVAPNRYFNGYNGSKYYEQSYEIANSLKEAINTYNNTSNGKEIPVYSAEITPETTISDVAGKIIIHYNASSDFVNNNITTVTGGLKQADSPVSINGAGMLFSFWNAPTDDKFYSMPQLVRMTWGAPPTIITPITSLADNELGWLFYEFNGIQTTSGTTKNNYVTVDQMTSAIDNYGTISYQNYLFKKHNIWSYIEIGGQDLNYSGESQPVEMANKFNPIMYNYVISGQRQSAPYGLVMMNFADNTSTQAIAAQSPELIRALITHNRLFWLQRKQAQPTQTSLINDGDIVSARAWDAPRRK